MGRSGADAKSDSEESVIHRRRGDTVLAEIQPAPPSYASTAAAGVLACLAHNLTSLPRLASLEIPVCRNDLANDFVGMDTGCSRVG
jgi:hypothetical protein